MVIKQDSLSLSTHTILYNMVVPKDNLLRKINNIVDFSFVHHEPKHKYCLTNGRNAINPIRLFKYLLLNT